MIAKPPEAQTTTDTHPRTVKTLYTVDEFDALRALPENEDKLLELIRGEVVQKMPNEQHGEVAAWIASVLIAYAYPRKLGRVGVEVQYRPQDDPYNDRLPDVSFRSGTAPAATETITSAMPDLAVEIKSPRNSIESLRQKAEFYLQNGSHVVWLVYPLRRQIEVCVPSQEYPGAMFVRLFDAEDIIDGGDVLPGFNTPVSGLFPPSFEDAQPTES